MAAVENDEVQQVFDSTKENKSFELSSPLRNDFTFLCNGLDSFLESLKMDSVLPEGPEARSESGASAERADPEDPGCPPPPSKHPRTSVISEPPHLSKVLLKDYDCPKPIIFFNQTIPVASHHKFTKSIEFVQHRPSRPADCLSKCRFPPLLRSLYKGIKPAPEPLPTPPKTRRGRQRNRLSLSDPQSHAFDNDDADGRRNLLPTEEDLRTTYDKFFNFRGIPYLFNCSRGKSCEFPVKCAQQVDSFGLFMEISPIPGTPLPPLVRENIQCVTRESCVVDEFSALVAVTAVQCKQTPLKRLFIPVSYHLKDKIGCLQGIIPEIFPELKIEQPVREVVEDLLDFVERQSSFVVNFDYDPDVSCTLSSADNSFNEEASQENIDSQNSITPIDPQSSILPVQRKKRGKCKEQNKVVRELKKLVNVTVTDETEEVAEDAEVNCSEPSCKYGCICYSISDKYKPSVEHCNFIDCCVECQCPKKSLETYVSIGDLSKEEKSWHQTIVRKRNNALEINYGVDRSKRRKKMPSRYENTVTGHAMNRFFDVSLRGNKKSVELKECKTPVSSKTIKPDVSIEKSKFQGSPAQKSAISSTFDEDMPKRDDEVAKRNAIIAEKMRKSLEKGQNKITASIERRLILTCGEASNSAGDLFVWCTVHNKYDCYCLTRIICGKTNNVICSPNSFNRSIADKYLGTMTLEPKVAADCREVAWYDQAKHCARTAGSIFNYGARNKDTLFKKKLFYLLDNKIVSYSNNYIKVKPVATFASETASDNHPFVPALARKITRGVGEVVKIVPAPNSVVDVGCRLISSLPERVLYLPPDDLDLESSDEEIVGKSKIVDKSDFLLDDPEYIPKPKRQILMPKPINRFCFSSHFQKKSVSPAKVVGKPKSSQHEPLSDSDVELVEDPIETYSLTSSPEPEFEDGGTLSDSGSDSDDSGDSSMSSKVDISNNEMYACDVRNRAHNDANQSTVEENCDSFSSPSKLVIDESVDTMRSPAKLVASDRTSLNSLDESCMRDQSQRCRKEASEELRKILTPLEKPLTVLEHRQIDNLSVSETGRPTAEDEEGGYPKLGLFCMGLPDLGYVKIRESRPGNFVMEDPCEPTTFRIFKNCKEASDYMKQLVSLCIDPEFACSEWVMVTRGVLEKYQSKPFDNSHQELLKKRKAEDSDSENKSSNKKRKLEVIKNHAEIKKTTIVQEKRQDTPVIIVKKNFDLKVQQSSSNSIEMDSNDIFESSHVLLTGDESDDAEKINSSNLSATPQSVAVPKTKKVVGTFPNFSEANSFIEMNYQSALYLRPSAPSARTTGTIQTAGTSQVTGKLVRLSSPLLSGPKIRGGVSPNKTVRTLLVRGIARKPGVARPLLRIRPPLAGTTVTSAGAQSASNGKIVSTTNTGVSKTMVSTVASLSSLVRKETTFSTDTGKSSVTTTFADAGESSQSSKAILPCQINTPMTSLSFPIKSCPKGSIVVSAAPFLTTPVKQVQSAATTSAARSVLSVASSDPHLLGVSSSTGSAPNNVKLPVISDTINPTPMMQLDVSSAGSTQAQVQNADVTSSSGLTGSHPTLVATHVTSSALTASVPVKQVESSTDSANADDGSPKDPVSCGGPLLPKHSDPPKVPGTFVIESFSTSSSSVSSPSSIIVRHGRPVLPKPVIPRVPPRRADVIVPRNDDFATLISPAPSDTPPAAKVPSENQVFNGVLLPKSDKKEIKAYICRKNPTTKSNYRSLLQKR